MQDKIKDLNKELHVLVECKHIGELENELVSRKNKIKELKGE